MTKVLDHQFYPTPLRATLEVLVRERFEGTFLEPACGDGAISRALKLFYPRNAITSSDLVDRGFGTGGINFLTHNFGRKWNNIVTNPPYSLAQEFVERGLELTTHKVVMLLRLCFLESQRRRQMFQTTPLRRVYIYSSRLTLVKNGLDARTSGSLAFAWYVWEHGYRGEPSIAWID
jgi:hypothetical protein